ncbi:MAG: SGNH/GDSL hydrolase family protein [Clostridia bacterium]
METNAFDGNVVITGCASKDEFIRMPLSVVSKVERLEELNTNTSGIRVRFETDSRTMTLKAGLGKVSEYMHMPVSAASGFDIYVNNIFRTNAKPQFNGTSINEAIDIHGNGKTNVIDIYFPLYNSVLSFFIDLEKGALKKRHSDSKKPLLFYGSSITQGACASRPGNSYANMLSQMLEHPVHNLGFSGNARGDIQIAEYISTLDISAFVYDYDHNAGDTEWLAATHGPFFRIIRAAQPNLPVVMMSRPGYERWIDTARRNTAVVMTTYLEALKAGDENVYFIDGRTLFGSSGRDRCSVDGTHPNDIGFLRMAETLYPYLKDILEV